MSGDGNSAAPANPASTAVRSPPYFWRNSIQRTASGRHAGSSTACHAKRSTDAIGISVRDRLCSPSTRSRCPAQTKQCQKHAPSAAATWAWHQDRAGNSRQGARAASRDRNASRDRRWDDDWWRSSAWRNWWAWRSDNTPHSASMSRLRYQLDEKILRSARGHPYYKSRKTGKFLCAIQCMATQCNNMRPPCNFSIQDPEDDHRTGHPFSYCRQELEWRRAQQRARQDDPDDP